MKVNYRVTFNRSRTLFTGHPRLIFLFVGVLTLGMLVGASGARSVRAATPQTYIVQVGAGGGDANSTLDQFGPGTLKVHRGDTVTWLINGFHDVHVGSSTPAVPFSVSPVNGKPTLQFNPQVAFPFGPKSGVTYKSGEAGSGLPFLPGASPVFSLVIDVAPGTTIPYVCDLHPGMTGTITVVDDSEQIPSPADVAVQAAAEFGASAAGASNAADKLEPPSATMMSAQGKATVQLGATVGKAALLQFFPYVTVIKAGESVTWKFGDNPIEPHTVSAPPNRAADQQIVPMPQEGKPPLLVAGPALLPMTQSGATIKTGDTFSSGLLVPIPGQLPTFTLTFTDPGVYPYSCNIHEGMNGVVVVLAK